MVKLKDAVLDIVGAYDGRYAYKGPRCVQIDLTNQCNNNCIGCWCNSPLLGEMQLPKRMSDATLPTDCVLSLLDDLCKLGTKELYFAGGGEPFMHPDAMRIFEYAKRKKFHVSINTNFTLVTQEMAQQLVDWSIDHLIVSVWAGTAEVYVATHPNKTPDDFDRFKRVLSFLNEYKKSRTKLPIIKVYNVIFNRNYGDFAAMIDFVRATGSESVECTLIDTIPGKTDALLLSNEEKQTLYNEAKALKKNNEVQAKDVFLANYDTFLRRLSGSETSKGSYDQTVMTDMPCYAGWMFARIMASGDVNSCLKSHRIPIGTIHEKCFTDIWNNARQQEFRIRTRNISTDDPYFRFIGNDTRGTVGCFRSCDNLGHSLMLHQKIEALKPWQRGMLKMIGKCGRWVRGLTIKN